jgi:hypothetical protein
VGDGDESYLTNGRVCRADALAANALPVNDRVGGEVAPAVPPSGARHTLRIAARMTNSEVPNDERSPNDEFRTGSALSAASAKPRAGQVLGATDRLGAEIADCPIHFAEVIATLYQHLGIDLETKLNDLAGRPRSVVDGKKPLPELA